MKKIFGLFAMAALAATGLTCCGGGGGSDGFAYKTIEYYNIASAAGSMFVDIQEAYPQAPGIYPALIRFGSEQGSPHKGKFTVDEVTDQAARVKVTFEPYDKLEQDEEATGFFQGIVGAATEENENITFNFPKFDIIMNYSGDSHGTADFTFAYQPTDEQKAAMTDEEKAKVEANDGYAEIKVTGNFLYLNE